MNLPGQLSTVVTLTLFALCSATRAADEFEQPPISYRTATPENVVSALQAQLDRGETELHYDNKSGYLAALLEHLEVPVESQVLVFSKTSLQRHRISPKKPRAIYFNDDAYIGFCLSGDVLEISVADPGLGTVFYTLDQTEAKLPRFVQQFDNCLICHSSSRTRGMPGHLVRSVFADAGGLPMLSAGSHMVDHTTPFEKRWGGWYVTGSHGDQTHMGNLVIRGKEVPHPVENAEGQNVTDLTHLVNLNGYLAPHSDIVALMVLEHQTLVHNRMIQANFATRQALHYEASIKEALGEPSGQRLESTTRRIANASESLVEALLMVDEAPLTAPIIGTSGYREWFSRQGPHDSQGRSLREFDLERRLYRYPCSYLITSHAFDSLPDETREYVWKRLWEILSGEDDSKKFSHLSEDDRQAIKEILLATKPELPGYWRE